jgi:hypothetical protein
MAKEKAMPVSHKIYFLPVYPQIVRAVRYESVPCGEVIKALKPVIEEHGQPKVDEAARELLDYMQVGKQLCAKLKPHLRVVCRQILGPLPEEADEFWKNADGSRLKNAPPEEPKPKRTKEEEPLVLPMSPEEELLKGIPCRDLDERLHIARRSLQANGARSFLGKEAKKEIRLLQAEYRRRELPIPETPPEPVQRKRGA